MVHEPHLGSEKPDAVLSEPVVRTGHRGRHVIMPVRVNVAADGMITALNTRGGELLIGTGWDGEGFNPIEILLAAIGGCAALDFSTVLARRGHPLSGLEIEVRGHRASDERLEAIEVYYVLPQGTEVDEVDTEVARRLTADVLCTASRTVQHGSPVEHLVVNRLPTGAGKGQLKTEVKNTSSESNDL